MKNSIYFFSKPYLEDTKTKERLRHKSKFKNRIQPDYMFGLECFGIKNGISAGLIVILIGLIWIIYDIISTGLLYARPLTVTLFGIIAVIISSIKKYKR